MVKKGTTSRLDEHFTESPKDERVPRNAKHIEWKANLYELRALIRSLRSSDSINSDLSRTASNFLFEDKIVTRKQLESGPTGSEKLDKLESILLSHDIPFMK